MFYYAVTEAESVLKRFIRRLTLKMVDVGISLGGVGGGRHM